MPSHPAPLRRTRPDAPNERRPTLPCRPPLRRDSTVSYENRIVPYITPMRPSTMARTMMPTRITFTLTFLLRMSHSTKRVRHSGTRPRKIWFQVALERDGIGALDRERDDGGELDVRRRHGTDHRKADRRGRARHETHEAALIELGDEVRAQREAEVGHEVTAQDRRDVVDEQEQDGAER